MRRLPKFLLIVTTLILLDRIVKEFVVANLTQAITVIPGLLSFVLVYNKGVAFGMLSNYSMIIQLFTGVVILFSLYALPKIPKQYIIPMAVLIGGAAGNFIDRFISPLGVIDYISVKYFSVFNIADMAISIAVFWMIILLIKDDMAEKRNDDAKKTKANKRKKTVKK